ncbi:MAG: hypothetical protein K8E66_01540 [Phycisphaerales bacterium]|nr:hypothetical protein [Phycisphaerales bacterium]
MRWFLLITAACLFAGCRAPDGPRSFVVPASRYAEAFDAARDELRRAGYTLERVDVVNGELLTDPKTVAGLATPFEPESASLGQMVQDTVNAQPRTVRVTFRDPTGAGPGSTARTDEITASVEVVLWRLRRPGWRLETESIRSSSYWIDRDLASRGVRFGMRVPMRHDAPFAAEFAGRVRQRLALADAEQP